MIDLCYWVISNCHKIKIPLEVAVLPYQLHPININCREQFQPEFLAIAPNNRIPAIVDNTAADGGAPMPLLESGAFLLYLVDKIGRFVLQDLRGRNVALQWLFWEMAAWALWPGRTTNSANTLPKNCPTPSRTTPKNLAPVRRAVQAPER